MDCNKQKRSYHMNVTEVVDGKIQEVMNFNFGGHHDLNALARLAEKKDGLSEKHANQLIVGMRLLHHVLKKYPDNEKFAAFLNEINNFKQQLKGSTCGCR